MDKKLSYTAQEIDARLGLIPTLEKSIANADINGRIFATISAASTAITKPKEGAWVLIGSGPYTIYRYTGTAWSNTGVSYQQGAATTTSQVTDTTQGKTQQTINAEVGQHFTQLESSLSDFALKVSQINSKLGKTETKTTITKEGEQLTATRGRILTDGTFDSNSGYHSDYIDIDGYDIDEIRAVKSSNASFRFIAFYDADKTFISTTDITENGSISSSTSWKYSTEKPTIPSNAKYIVVSGHYGLTDGSAKLVISKTTIVEVDRLANIETSITNANTNITTINTTLESQSESIEELTDKVSGVDEMSANMAAINAVNGVSKQDVETKMSGSSLFVNSGYRIKAADGTLVSTASGAVSDFLKISEYSIKHIHSAAYGSNYLALAFYTTNDESSFISGVTATTTYTGSWKYRDDDAASLATIMPSNAVYMRIASQESETAEGLGYLLTEEEKYVSSSDLGTANAVYNFNVDVNAYIPAYDKSASSQQDNYLLGHVWCQLDLPSTYTSSSPSKLVIYCHGYSNGIGESGRGSIAIKNYLVKKGYAFLQVNGLPDDVISVDNVPIGSGYGSALHIQGIINAFNYVRSKFNIDKQGVCVIAKSMGGMAAVNLLGNAKIIPIRCLVLDAPLLSMETAFIKPTSGIANNRKMIAKLFGFSFAEYNTAHSTSLNIDTFDWTSVANITELWGYNKEKCSGFDPMTSNSILVGSDRYKFCQTPILLLTGSNDGTSDGRLTDRLAFVENVKRGGGNITLREPTSSTHGMLNSSVDGVDTFTFDGVEYPVTIEEARLFIERY